MFLGLSPAKKVSEGTPFAWCGLKVHHIPSYRGERRHGARKVHLIPIYRSRQLYAIGDRKCLDRFSWKNCLILMVGKENWSDSEKETYIWYC